MAVVVGSIKKTMEKLKRLQTAKSVNVFAGVPAGKTYEDGTSIAQVFFWLEYGTKYQSDGNGGESYHIPPRPVLRSTGDANGPEWNDIFWKYFVASDFDVKRPAGLLGDEIAGDIRAAISTWTYPPNAPSTIKAKGFNAPLRETKALLQSITSRATIGGGSE